MPRAHGVPGAAGVDQALLSRTRILSLLLPIVCLCFAIFLGLPGTQYAPDASQYRLLALGQRGAVPPPFSARILGPALAGWLGRVTGMGVDTGFLLLGILCLVALLALVAGLLWSWRAPAAIFAGIFLMPLWVDLFHDYYLPDVLHAAILAAILLCLLFGHTGLGLLLLFPAYLARESTLLVAFCLVFACWRRIRLSSAAIGFLALMCGGLVSRHFGQGGPASVHGLGGGVYILGKLFWSFFKNFLGLPLWSNTLPECTPVWVATIPPGLHLGAIRQVGVCHVDLWGPARLLLAWFGIFGIGPAFAAVLWRKIFSARALFGRSYVRAASSLKREPATSEDKVYGAERTPGLVIVFRFCIVYGVISILMTPLLGASADRLVEYGWPFYMVVLPWFVCRSDDASGARSAGVLLLHLATCWLAWLGFQQQTYLYPGLAVLALNGLGYVLLRRARFGATEKSTLVTY
jgi:hypothetical protein